MLMNLNNTKNLIKVKNILWIEIKVYGEQNAEELGPCILDPETRNVAQITVEDVEEAQKLFEILMGTSVSPRREWLLAHSEEASDNIW